MRIVRGLCGRLAAGWLLALCLGMAIVPAAEPALTAEQKNAIAMLNDITVLTKNINASKNSRLCMEEAYGGLINNTYPNAVDARTLSQLTGLLDTMEKYRMIDVKRERLQLVYEQNQAKAVRALLPSASKLLRDLDIQRPDKLVSAVAHMAVDAISSYASKEEDLKYLKDGWALDDEEAQVLHESRKGTFTYMIKMVNDYDLPGDLVLTEEMVDEFVQWKNDPNLLGRIQFLESNRKTYQSYGGYWLLLADSYYQDGQYEKCLEAVDSYENMGIRVFRRDYELAKVLPLAIASADLVLDISDYRSYAASHAKMLVENTRHDDWALRYYAAVTYADLYARTRDQAYLQDCYDISLDSVNYLMSTQRNLNGQYLAKVQEEEVPKDAGKKEKEEIKNYNKFLKETRKKELPPVYEPLMLNCDLLIAAGRELGISEEEQNRVDRLLHPGGEALFLTESLEKLSWFHPSNGEEDLEGVGYGGDQVILPAVCVADGTVIEVSIVEPGATKPILLSDWVIDKVERDKKNEFSSFEAAYTSKEARKVSWKPGCRVTVSVFPNGDKEVVSRFVFTTEESREGVLDALQPWKGYKNGFLDYARVWENGIAFVRAS